LDGVKQTERGESGFHRGVNEILPLLRCHAAENTSHRRFGATYPGRSHEFCSGEGEVWFNKFSWGRRTERTGIWGR